MLVSLQQSLTYGLKNLFIDFAFIFINNWEVKLGEIWAKSINKFFKK